MLSDISSFALNKPSPLVRSKSGTVSTGPVPMPGCLTRSRTGPPNSPNSALMRDVATHCVSDVHPRPDHEQMPLRPPSLDIRRCCICLEDKPVDDLIISGLLCGNAECSESLCGTCLRSYLSERVSANRFALPPIKCLACHSRIPTSSWKAFADQRTFASYEQSAQDALVLRCPGCDAMQSFAEDTCLTEESAAKAIDNFISRSRDADSARKAWSEFDKGAIGADRFLELLHTCGPPDIQDDMPERRLAKNGKPYTLLQFLEYYDGYEYTGRNSWYSDSAWVWRDWSDYERSEAGWSDYDHSSADVTEEVMLGCEVCGCSAEFDEDGDRICWCDSCKLDGCKVAGTLDPDGACDVCGCTSEFDEHGDRICWCDTCQVDGCRATGTNSRHAETDVSEISKPPAEPMAVTADAPTSADVDGPDACHVCTGTEHWEAATPWSDAKRWVPDEWADGWSCPLDQLQEWYGEECGRQRWEAAPIRNITPILRLIVDVERRTVLHLAYLRSNPKTYTPCCSHPYCFRCHVGTWHSGTTCAEMQARELDVEVQFCPSCNVPTQRSEGCSSMVCPCGQDWHWKGDEDDSDVD